MSSKGFRRPILITGAHRCGSTWLAEMLRFADDTLVVQEPFNLNSWAYALDGLAKHWFTYAPALPRQDALRAFEKVLHRKTGRVFTRRQPQRYLPFMRRGRLIVKDPIACFSSEWLAENFGLQVVVLVRHPAAFAASLKRMGWSFQFEDFLRQERLMEKRLAPYRREIESKPQDIISQAALLWKCLYGVLFDYLDRNPQWIVRTHEEMSLDPVCRLEELYELLGLKWSPRVRYSILEYTRASNPVSAPGRVAHQTKRDSASNVYSWKQKLSEKEMRVLYRETHKLASRFYSEEIW